MPMIRVLPVELRNKIAAGEVIERPASVVKELIENSIDAGSSEITIEVLRAGKGLIKVTDNGSGMGREDALLCLERHATSKLTSEDDLFNIRTMGFRGEALPSIASVSRMKLVTGLRDNPPSSPLNLRGEKRGIGVSIEIQGGQVREIKDFPSLGTSVEVRDLFFNTPARKKFLKSDSTELFHIIDSVTKEALSHWDISFRLLTEKQETMNLPRASGPRERILQIYGLEFIEGLMEVSTPHSKGGTGGIKMTAFIAKGDSFRNNRAHQFIFINGRPVKDQTVSHAAYEAYAGILPRDKHPVFFIFIYVDPRKVDFNVHPTKREVRFENKQDIHRFISHNLREELKRERSRYVASFSEAPDRASTGNNLPLSPLGLKEEFPGRGAQADSRVSETIDFLYQPSLPFIYLGDTFIAMSGRGGLTVIDHHAAHERVLFENLLKGINMGCHQLLFPRQVRLSPKEYALILENKTLLFEMGIELDDFGHDTLMVRSLPDELKEADIRGILSDIAGALMEGVPPLKSLRELLAAKIACHSSVRGKEILTQEEFQELISSLEMTEHPDQCPHGRPTRIFLSLDDLKKMFKRK